MTQAVKLGPRSEPHLYEVIVVGHWPAIGLRCVDAELLTGLDDLQLREPGRKSRHAGLYHDTEAVAFTELNQAGRRQNLLRINIVGGANLIISTPF